MACEETQPLPGSSPTSKSLFMIAERRGSRGSSLDIFARLKAPDQIKTSDEDMFGNVYIHHACASYNPDYSTIRNVLRESPSGASMKNQFGRIPLHYALDRTKVHLDCFLLLLKVRDMIVYFRGDLWMFSLILLQSTNMKSLRHLTL